VTNIDLSNSRANVAYYLANMFVLCDAEHCRRSFVHSSVLEVWWRVCWSRCRGEIKMNQWSQPR